MPRHKRRSDFSISRRLDPNDAYANVLGRHHRVHPPLNLNEDEEGAALSRARQRGSEPEEDDKKKKWWEK